MKRIIIGAIAPIILISQCSTKIGFKDTKVIKDREQNEWKIWQTERESALIEEIDRAELEEYAKAITVKISGKNTEGSGTIIGRKENSYIVVTNAHVIIGLKTISVQTADGEIYKAKEIINNEYADRDIAIIEFKSDRKYLVATIDADNWLRDRSKFKILAAGYSVESGLKYSRGKIGLIPEKSLQEGYQIGYTSEIESGMSGGPILNAVTGKLIGINGVSAYPISNNGYVYEDGIKPTAESIEEMRSYNWGIPIQTVLAKLDRKIIVKYNLPQVRNSVAEFYPRSGNDPKY